VWLALRAGNVLLKGNVGGVEDGIGRVEVVGPKGKPSSSSNRSSGVRRAFESLLLPDPSSLESGP
jgi:hypothetical protein